MRKVFLLCILALAAGFMLYSAFQETAIMDELAHIPAGYGYVRHLDFRLNPEHPPLVKALSALPLLLIQPSFPIQSAAWQTAINGQWDMGSEFLYASGNDPDQIVRLARILPIILTLLLIILVYKIGGLLPAFLTAMSPLVLAHGHYVTTDIGATLGILLALWRLSAFLESPSRKNLWFAGLALGVAELLKFSAVLLVPYAVFLFAAHWLFVSFPRTRESSVWWHVRSLIFIFLIAYGLVVYPVYALFTINYPLAKQVSDTEFILQSFGKRYLADSVTKMAGIPLLRPAAEYMLGVLMVTQRAAGGNTAYFLGEVSAAGSRLYFPLVYVLKESIPALLIVWLPFLWWLWRKAKAFHLRGNWLAFSRYIKNHFLEFNLIGFAIFYWAYSMKSPLNIGVRHVLPTIPLLYIATSFAWRRNLSFVPFIRRTIGYLLLAIGLSWVLLETVFVSPHFISYFNEFAGGTANGYRYVTDSNYDWGQDLLYLKKFAATHPEIDKIAVDYFGGGSPAYYLGEKQVGWNSAKGDPRAEGIEWLAVSINTLEGAVAKAAPGFERKPEDEYRWLRDLRGQAAFLGGIPEPDYRAGTSIFIYRLQ